MTSPSLTPAAAETASKVNVAAFVEKLESSNNYNTWKEQMLRFMESQGMAGLPPPRPTEEQHDAAWTRSDCLLKGWLLESLSDEVAQTVANSATASDMWLELENNFSQCSQGKDWHEYRPLYKAALSGDWDTAKVILEHNPGAVEAQVAFTLETALHVAVSSGKSASFVARLVECMSDEALAIADINGSNALHIAAYTGNLPATNILAHRLPALLYKPTNSGSYPVQEAARNAHRQTLEFLISQTRDDMETNPFASSSGLLLLRFMISSDFLGM